MKNPINLVQICFNFINVQAKYVGRGEVLENTNVGHYFTMCVIIYLNICVDYGVNGFYNMLQMSWYLLFLEVFPNIFTHECIKNV